MTPPSRSHNYRSKSRPPNHHHHHHQHHHTHEDDDASDSSVESEARTDAFDEGNVQVESVTSAWSEPVLDPDGRFMYQTHVAPDGKLEWAVSGSGSRPLYHSPFPENHMAQQPYARTTANYSTGYYPEQAEMNYPQYVEKSHHAAHTAVKLPKSTDKNGEKRARRENRTMRRSKTSNHLRGDRNDNYHDSRSDEKGYHGQHHYRDSHYRSGSLEGRGNQRRIDWGIKVEDWVYEPRYSYRGRSRY
ncbi:hypothetical protein GGR57DRAFT_460438 [Xylariaceae sp. FL1272]|nr:hypothetical protein GGR57DRAFT_460438 [Xylariaceae sp. FL1272]